MAIQAVLTGDIVNSTRLEKVAEKKMLKHLKNLLAAYQFEFYRGDSFQVYFKDATTALQTALLCRTAAISIAEDYASVPSDIRVSIGIGKVKKTFATLGEAREEPFILSGRAFDTLSKNNTRLVIASSNVLASQGFDIMADYINSIFNNMTGKQAGVIFELLKEEAQESVATKLKKSKSTISQHANAGGWPQIEKLIAQYKHLITLLV